MNIKVGDKVRIKTEEELLASDGSWHIVENSFKELFYAKNYYSGGSQHRYTIALNKLGKIYSVSVSETGQEGQICVNPNNTTIPIDAIAEILPRLQTLDEYICNLPLEERAKYFVYRSVYDWHSTLFDRKASFVFEDQALQATIEALKGEKRL